MIVTGDIETILVRDLKPFGIPTYKKDAIPEGEVNKSRLTELERQASGLRSVSSFDGSTYRYKVYSTHQERDVPLKCHFVNVKIMFEILNVR